MKMKKVEVLPIVLSMTTQPNDVFDVKYYLSETDFVQVLDLYMVQMYLSNFSEWYILKPEAFEKTDEEYFTDVWLQYKRMAGQNWDMLFKALFSEYNPLDNYDITEEKSGSFTHTPDGVTDEMTQTVTASGTNKPTVENFVATYQSGEKAHNKSVTTGETTTTTNTTIKSTYTDEDGHTIHRHGNAGVMTTSEVARQEILLRKTELATEIIMGGFVDKFMLYAGGIEL